MSEGTYLDYVGVLIPAAAKQIVDEFRHVADVDVGITVHVPFKAHRKKGHGTGSAQITAISSHRSNDGSAHAVRRYQAVTINGGYTRIIRCPMHGFVTILW